MSDNIISKIQIDDIVLKLRDADAFSNINSITSSINSITSNINSITSNIKSITTNASYKYKSGDTISIGSGTAQWIGHLFNATTARFTVPVFKEAPRNLNVYIGGRIACRIATQTNYTPIGIGLTTSGHPTYPNANKDLRDTYKIKGFIQSAHLMFEVYDETSSGNYTTLGTQNSVCELSAMTGGITISFE